MKTREKAIHVLRKLGADKKMNEKLNNVRNRYRSITKNVPIAEAMDFGVFLQLLELAEYGYPLGKSSAIKYAFGLGYMAMKDCTNFRIREVRNEEETELRAAMAKINHVDIEKVNAEAEDMWKRLNLSANKAISNLPAEDYRTLYDIAKYHELGAMTAIYAAFCMGYDAGKGGEA